MRRHRRIDRDTNHERWLARVRHPRLGDGCRKRRGDLHGETRFRARGVLRSTPLQAAEPRTRDPVTAPSRAVAASRSDTRVRPRLRPRMAPPALAPPCEHRSGHPIHRPGQHSISALAAASNARAMPTGYHKASRRATGSATPRSAEAGHPVVFRSAYPTRSPPFTLTHPRREWRQDRDASRCRPGSGAVAACRCAGRDRRRRVRPRRSPSSVAP